MIPFGKPVLGMILKGFPRISETFISNEILLLEKLGFSIRLFSMRHPRESFCHESVTHIRADVDYLPDALLKYLPKLLYANGMLAGKRPKIYARAWITACRRLLRSHHSATLKHFLQAGYLVHQFLPGRGIAHLHAHFAHSPTSVALFASQLSGLPYSFTAHAKDIYTSHPEQLREKLTLARFVVTCTQYNKEYLSRLSNGAGTPIYRIYHGIDIDRFSQVHRPEISSQPYRLLTVARLTPKKGLPTVLKAVRILCDKGFSVRHTLIGDGDDRLHLLAMIRALKLENVTRWIGTQPQDVVVAHYRQADLFILGCEIASNGDRDGIPNVFIESMAMGVPVVATQVSAIPEVVEHEKTGLLVPPGRPDRLADAMIRLLTDIPLKERVIAAARHRVRNTFDNRVLIRELAAVYKQNLGVFRGLPLTAWEERTRPFCAEGP